MAGHSKWANIRHRKERADVKKGKIVSRIAKEIISAVKLGGSDPSGNPRLRIALQRARENNVSNDVIERNIKKASSSDQSNFDEITYELYGYGGVGILVEALTDNKNRLSSEIRIAINKRGGTQAMPGAVAFNFDRKGVIQVKKTKIDEDALFLIATDAGAEDFTVEEDAYIILTDPAKLYTVKEALIKQGVEPDEASLEQVPKHIVTCDAEAEKSNTALIEWLENIDDVDSVYHNM